MDLRQRPPLCLPRCMEGASPRFSVRRKAARAEGAGARGAGGGRRQADTPSHAGSSSTAPASWLPAERTCPLENRHVPTLKRARAVSAVTAGAEPEIAPLEWKTPLPQCPTCSSTLSPQLGRLRRVLSRRAPPGLADDSGGVPPVAWLWAGEHRGVDLPPGI